MSVEALTIESRAIFRTAFVEHLIRSLATKQLLAKLVAPHNNYMIADEVGPEFASGTISSFERGAGFESKARLGVKGNLSAAEMEATPLEVRRKLLPVLSNFADVSQVFVDELSVQETWFLRCCNQRAAPLALPSSVSFISAPQTFVACDNFVPIQLVRSMLVLQDADDPRPAMTSLLRSWHTNDKIAYDSNERVAKAAGWSLASLHLQLHAQLLVQRAQSPHLGWIYDWYMSATPHEAEPTAGGGGGGGVGAGVGASEQKKPQEAGTSHSRIWHINWYMFWEDATGTIEKWKKSMLPFVDLRADQFLTPRSISEDAFPFELPTLAEWLAPIFQLIWTLYVLASSGWVEPVKSRQAQEQLLRRCWRWHGVPDVGYYTYEMTLKQGLTLRRSLGATPMVYDRQWKRHVPVFGRIWILTNLLALGFGQEPQEKKGSSLPAEEGTGTRLLPAFLHLIVHEMIDKLVDQDKKYRERLKNEKKKLQETTSTVSFQSLEERDDYLYGTVDVDVLRLPPVSETPELSLSVKELKTALLALQQQSEVLSEVRSASEAEDSYRSLLQLELFQIFSERPLGDVTVSASAPASLEQLLEGTERSVYAIHCESPGALTLREYQTAKPTELGKHVLDEQLLKKLAASAFVAGASTSTQNLLDLRKDAVYHALYPDARNWSQMVRSLSSVWGLIIDTRHLLFFDSRPFGTPGQERWNPSIPSGRHSSAASQTGILNALGAWVPDSDWTQAQRNAQRYQTECFLLHYPESQVWVEDSFSALWAALYQTTARRATAAYKEQLQKLATDLQALPSYIQDQMVNFLFHNLVQDPEDGGYSIPFELMNAKIQEVLLRLHSDADWSLNQSLVGGGAEVKRFNPETVPVFLQGRVAEIEAMREAHLKAGPFELVTLEQLDKMDQLVTSIISNLGPRTKEIVGAGIPGQPDKTPLQTSLSRLKFVTQMERLHILNGGIPGSEPFDPIQDLKKRALEEEQPQKEGTLVPAEPMPIPAVVPAPGNFQALPMDVRQDVNDLVNLTEENALLEADERYKGQTDRKGKTPPKVKTPEAPPSKPAPKPVATPIPKTQPVLTPIPKTKPVPKTQPVPKAKPKAKAPPKLKGKPPRQKQPPKTPPPEESPIVPNELDLRDLEDRLPEQKRVFALTTEEQEGDMMGEDAALLFPVVPSKEQVDTRLPENEVLFDLD